MQNETPSGVYGGPKIIGSGPILQWSSLVDWAKDWCLSPNNRSKVTWKFHCISPLILYFPLTQTFILKSQKQQQHYTTLIGWTQTSVGESRHDGIEQIHVIIFIELLFLVFLSDEIVLIKS
jgi:hypothetical protein